MGKMELEPHGAALTVPTVQASSSGFTEITGWLGRKGARCFFLYFFKYKFKSCKKNNSNQTGKSWALSGSSILSRGSPTVEGTWHLLRGRCSGSVPSFLLPWKHGSLAINIPVAHPRTMAEDLTEAGSRGLACRAMGWLGWGGHPSPVSLPSQFHTPHSPEASNGYKRVPLRSPWATHRRPACDHHPPHLPNNWGTGAPPLTINSHNQKEK